MMDYELVIGLEVHVQLSTNSKAFCSDANAFGHAPNTLVGPVSLGMPGTLPVVNRAHVEGAIKLGLSLDCTLADHLYFDRKHYFYPDLPKGYQISQHNHPICRKGTMTLRLKEGVKNVRIHQIHMEEDAGKSLHVEGESFTRIDLNRAGAPLLEIVTEPDLRSAEEVDVLMTEMRRLVRWLDISDGHMEQGSLRCDCNISIRPKGADFLGPRCEIKNLNSMRYARQAIAYEKQRQIDLVENGGVVEQETRQFDPLTGTTRSLRDKEDAHDYRYLPEPDMPPQPIDPNWVMQIKEGMPELPDGLLHRLQEEYSLSAYQADQLIDSRASAACFLSLASAGAPFSRAANLVINQVLPYSKEAEQSPQDYPLSIPQLKDLLLKVEEGKISHTIAVQKILPLWVDAPTKALSDWEKELGLNELPDHKQVESLAREILGQFPDKVKAYQKGKKGLIGFFMGQLMQKSGGKADPKESKSLLIALLEEE